MSAQIDFSPHIPKLAAWLAQGKTQISYCENNGLCNGTLQGFLAKSPNIADDLLRARALGAMAEADDAQRIADDPTIGVKQARNMIDVRKWRASKFMPKVFGERIDLNITERIDIGGALIEARRRALQPMCNPELLANNQDAEYVELLPHADADTQSLANPAADDQDVFS